MKKNLIFFNLALVCVCGFIFSSCEKTPENDNEEIVHDYSGPLYWDNNDLAFAQLRGNVKQKKTISGTTVSISDYNSEGMRQKQQILENGKIVVDQNIITSGHRMMSYTYINTRTNENYIRTNKYGAHDKCMLMSGDIYGFGLKNRLWPGLNESRVENLGENEAREYFFKINGDSVSSCNSFNLDRDSTPDAILVYKDRLPLSYHSIYSEGNYSNASYDENGRYKKVVYHFYGRYEEIVTMDYVVVNGYALLKQAVFATASLNVKYTFEYNKFGDLIKQTIINTNSSTSALSAAITRIEQFIPNETIRNSMLKAAKSSVDKTVFEYVYQYDSHDNYIRYDEIIYANDVKTGESSGVNIFEYY